MEQHHPLDVNTRKSLCVQLGEPAGRQLADLIMHMAQRIDDLERSKVDITPIAPATSRPIAAGRELPADSWNRHSLEY